MVFRWLKNGVLDDGVLRLPDADARFPIGFFRTDREKDAANVIFVRECAVHILEIFCWVRDGKTLDGKTQRGVVVRGPPGDGKVCKICIVLLLASLLANSLHWAVVLLSILSMVFRESRCNSCI